MKRSVSAPLKVIVAEEDGELVAMVVDPQRPPVRIPLGVVEEETPARISR
jgi:hypothetical protein